MFTRLSVDSLTILLVSPLQFRTAARFADQHMSGLRAGDALLLAICADHGATLCTLDRLLSEAGPNFLGILKGSASGEMTCEGAVPSGIATMTGWPGHGFFLHSGIRRICK
jgi:hypothetical protein